MHHVFHGNHHHHFHSYGLLLPEATAAAAATEETGTHTFQMLQRVGASGQERVPAIEEHDAPQHDDVILKKRSKDQGRTSMVSKPKKNKKAMPPKEASASPSERGRSETKSMDIVVNGIDLVLSGMPTPVCTCTGQPQRCYRWGAGGWQSACCTTSISIYPLPLSTKKRGVRIAGRKMNQGAFKKVLEKLQVEGQDLVALLT